MKNVGISVRWGEARDPQVGLKLNGCKGKEELKEVILVIEDCLEKKFPGKVKRIKSVSEFLEGRSEGTMTIPGLETLPEPKPEDNIDCYLQERGMGTLICKATNHESTRTICFNCSIGKVYREKRCREVSGKIRVIKYDQGFKYFEESMFCAFLKDNVSLDFCRHHCPKPEPAPPISYI